MNATAERKHTLVKVAPGDYLLPSNDGEMLWRITTYEDGPSLGLDWPRDRTFWGAWKYVGRINWREGLTLDQADELVAWGDWDGPWEPFLETRRAAIEAALR
jgi:hypothetical protein